MIIFTWKDREFQNAMKWFNNDGPGSVMRLQVQAGVKSHDDYCELIKRTFKCGIKRESLTVTELIFEDRRHAMMFILRWS